MLPRVIPTKVHGVTDYATGALLLAASTGLRGTPSRMALAVGSSVLAQSVFTDYELGAVRVIPMRAHLALDVVTGLALAGSAFAPPGDGATGVASRVVPVVAGLGEVLTALMTSTEPPRRWRRRRRRLMFAR